jgi:hypothetical protein
MSLAFPMVGSKWTGAVTYSAAANARDYGVVDEIVTRVVAKQYPRWKISNFDVKSENSSL